MLIGVTGDTHGKEKAIEQLALKAPRVEQWIHTGDYATDADILADKSGLPVIRVAGNNDIAIKSDLNKVFTIEGHTIWLTHGHKYLSKGTTNLLYRAEELKAKIVIYGHTHVPQMVWYDDILLINPGSPSLPRGGSKKGFIVLDLQEGKNPTAKYYALN